jgi:hypothetical protein
MISDEMLEARLAEAQRLAQTTPTPSPQSMTLADAAILAYRIDQRMTAWRTSLLELRAVGVLTQADVKRFNRAQVGEYRIQMAIYASVLNTASRFIPRVVFNSLVRVLPSPTPPTPFLTTAELRVLPRGIGNPAVAAPAAAAPAAAAAAVPISLWIIAALLALGLGIGLTYIAASKATEVINYAASVDAEEQAAKARVTAIQTCIAQGGDVEACGRAMAGAVPTPPRPPASKDPLQGLEQAGTYLVWGLVAVAGLSVLPVITGTIQSLRSIAPPPAPRDV